MICNFCVKVGIFSAEDFYFTLIFLARSFNLLIVELILSIYNDILSSLKLTLEKFKSLEEAFKILNNFVFYLTESPSAFSISS